jgi:hypothetical protein
MAQLVKKMSYIDALRWLGQEYLSADFEEKLVRMGVRPLTAFPSEDSAAGAYTRPLFGTTYALSDR